MCVVFFLDINLFRESFYLYINNFERERKEKKKEKSAMIFIAGNAGIFFSHTGVNVLLRCPLILLGSERQI